MTTFEDIAKTHNKRYIEQTDWRVRKPHVLFHEDDPNRKIVLSNNWVLESDKLETMLDKPNDVAIYSNISNSSLKKARLFHRSEILPRQKKGFPSKVLQQDDLKKYYDYFETIITSAVFAYTAIEAFANICIPNNYIYSYTDKTGQIVNVDKDKIERNCSLREKLKIILPEILKCNVPTQQYWWHKFTELENIRNEIIHSKKSKSEERYSKLLSSSVFTKIEIHKDVIEFFGKAINDNKIDLLDEYPNGFGYDTYRVKKASDENFKKSIETLRR